MLVTRAGTVRPLPISLHLMEDADNGHFGTGYTLQIDLVPPANNRTVSERPFWSRGHTFRVRARVSPTSS